MEQDPEWFCLIDIAAAQPRCALGSHSRHINRSPSVVIWLLSRFVCLPYGIVACSDSLCGRCCCVVFFCVF
jgi:hypothetical protein